MFSKIKAWISLAVVITALCGLIYLAVQQDIRQSANDPQIQISEDIADSLTAGKKLEEILPSLDIDISKSLSPFIIIFNDTGKPITSNAQLSGRIPTPPPGVFSYTKKHGQDRFTWEPKTGVRIAAVVTSFKQGSGFVLVGRSLREVEKREDRLFKHVGLAWGISLAATFITTMFFAFFNKKK